LNLPSDFFLVSFYFCWVSDIAYPTCLGKSLSLLLLFFYSEKVFFIFSFICLLERLYCFLFYHAQLQVLLKNEHKLIKGRILPTSQWLSFQVVNFYMMTKINRLCHLLKVLVLYLWHFHVIIEIIYMTISMTICIMVPNISFFLSFLLLRWAGAATRAFMV
jgi:hypothetical protein